MNNSLNKKIKECYAITQKVIKKYEQLLPIMVNYAYEDTKIFIPYTQDLYKLVLKEHQMYQNLNLEEINYCLTFFQNESTNESKITSRFQRKLDILKDMYQDNSITMKELQLDITPNDIPINVFTSLISLIDLKTLTTIKAKLNNLKIVNYQELISSKQLSERFNLILLTQSYSNDLTELVALFYNMNLDNLPNFEINTLIDTINNKYHMTDELNFNTSDITLINLAKITIERLSNINFSNDSVSTFDTLLFVTRLEILIEHLSKNALIILLNHCESINTTNKFGLNQATKLIKEKIKGDYNE